MGLVVFSEIWTLLHFNDFDIFQTLNAMAAMSEKNNVAAPKLSGVKIISFGVVKVNSTFAASNEKYLLRVRNLARDNFVSMRLNYMPSGML